MNIDLKEKTAPATGATIFAGIDIGSITAKAALVSKTRDGKIILLDTCVIPTGYHHAQAAQTVFDAVLNTCGIDASGVARIVATGYGRNAVDFSHKALTEILCHGKGAHFSHPGIQGIIDVGGQDSKAIALDHRGQVDNFAMNDKCAAGTGRFLEVMARALDLSLDELGPMGLKAQSPAKISSICTVFAESEVISMIAAQKSRADIIAGIHEATAVRVATLARKISIKAPVIMTGGVAKNPGVVKALEACLGLSILVGDAPQENGAVGAAVLAAESADSPGTET